MKSFKRKVVVLAAAMMICLCPLILSGCGTDDIDINGYADSQIELTGLAGGDEVVTVQQLKDLECITKKTHSTSDKIGEVKATGPLLDTFLAEYETQQSDYSKIIFYGADGYSIKLTKDYIKDHDIILAFGIDGEPLDEESKPVRVIIPNSDSAYWIRMVERIEFVK